MIDSKFWKNYFQVYDALNLLIPYQELLETICDELRIKKGEKILEAGCGTGNLALKIKERGGEVVGLDNCREALDIYQKKDPTAKLILADLTKKLPFTDSYFDKIASGNTLYVIPQEERPGTLKEFHRVLKPGGKIVLVNPIKGAKPSKIYWYHIKQSFKVRGILITIKDIIRMIVPTLKMFYFNYQILKERKSSFLTQKKQETLLKTANFSVIESKLVYANQGILTSANKPSL